MRAGRLDRKIDIQRKASTQGADGGCVETWSNLASRIWASAEPVSGDEKFSNPQVAAKHQTEFRVRWAASIADVSPLDRIVYPSVPDTSPATAIPDRSVYDILSVAEI